MNEKQPEVMAREMWVTPVELRDLHAGGSLVVWPDPDENMPHRVLVQTLPADAPPFPVEFSRPGVRVKLPGWETVTTAPAFLDSLDWYVRTKTGSYPCADLTVIPPTPTDPIERMRDEHPDEAVRALAAEVLELRKEVGR